MTNNKYHVIKLVQFVFKTSIVFKPLYKVIFVKCQQCSCAKTLTLPDKPADSGFIKVVRLEVQQLPAIAPAAFGLPEYSFLSKLTPTFVFLTKLRHIHLVPGNSLK